MKHYTKYSTAAAINPKKGFNIHLFVFLMAIPAIWCIWYLTGHSYPWPIWSSLSWGIGVLFHYLGVFVFRKHPSNH